LGEVPATMLLYLYLGQLASRVGGPARTLRWVALAVPVVTGLPLVALPLSHLLRHHRQHPAVAGMGAVLMTASLSLTMVSGSAVVRLAWRLARPAGGGGIFTRACEPLTP
jgi:uncharacterized membrane protein